MQFGGVVGGTTPVGAIIITGNLDLNANILQSDNTAGATSVAVSGTSDLGANVKTTGDQTYTGNTTVSADITLTGGAQLTFGGTVNSSSTDSASDTDNLSIVFTETEFDGIVGGTYGLGAISITGALDLDAAITNASSLSVSTTSNLGANVTTSGTQTYSGAVTLSGADRTLQGSTINFGNTLTGTGSHDLIITGALDLDGVATSIVDLSVSTTSNLGANVTTSGTQTYSGAVTLSGADRTLQGSTINFGNTLTGTGSHDLIITGALDLDGVATSIVDLSVSTTSNLGANVTTSGTQTYTGAVTLSGAARTLTTTGDTVTFVSTVDGAQDLTVDTTNSGASSAATVQFGGVVGGTTPVGAIIITGNLDLNANILQSDNTAGATSVAVSGTSDLGANVKTTGDQTYTGNTTVSADITLTGGAQLTFGGTVNSSSTDSASDTDNLSIVFTETEFDGIVGGTYGLGAISITGALDLDAQYYQCHFFTCFSTY